MLKIPCGGFALDENFLGMNENDELSLLGGGSEDKAYQYVVTDGDGKTKWEDRLAYDGNRLVIDFKSRYQLVKVGDEVPSWVSMDAPMKVWLSNGFNDSVTPEEYMSLGNGNFAVGEFIFFIMTDNVEVFDTVFPEKGVYFVFVPNTFYVTGVASVDSDIPEIMWDGNIGVIKKIDEKFIPNIPAEKLPNIPAEKLPNIPAEKLPNIPAHVIEFNGTFSDSIENTSQPSYTVKNLNYSEILSIFNSKNFVIKDNALYYRPISFTISTDGALFIHILVNKINNNGNLVFAELVCFNGNKVFYRNNYWTIAGTQSP